MVINLFGVHVPDEIIQRLEGADDQRAEGRAICAELLQGFSEIEGCAGAHGSGRFVKLLTHPNDGKDILRDKGYAGTVRYPLRRSLDRVRRSIQAACILCQRVAGKARSRFLSR